MYQAYIFDLDGTLLNTLEDLKNALNATLREFGYPERTLEDTRTFVGNGLKNLLQRATEFKADNVEEMLVFLKAYYSVHCEDFTKPYDGILALLETLKKQGKKIGIVSNKADPYVKQLAKSYFKGLIDVAIGENEDAGIRKKPAPDSVFTAMKELGVGKEECVYVGDSETDIETAKNAGVDCISVTWGFRDRGYLEEQGGRVFVDHPSEIA